MSLRCPRCSAALPPQAKFCLECGAALSQPTASQPRSQPPAELATGDPLLDGERKTITVLFADIKGSMSQIEDLDPEAARAVVDPALAIMTEAVNRYQGQVAQSTGDGVFALFGAPIAHEDHPQRAIYAALRMQVELRRYSERLRAEGKAPVEIRVGINTGEVVMRSVDKDQSHTEYLPAGHAVSLASRLQTIAPTGSIAVGEHTRRLVEGYFELKSLGPTRIKGVTDAVNVFEVLGLGPLRTRLQRSASRGLSRFVGRDDDLAQLKRALDVVKAGRGQIVAAMAEPGVGKSRLFFEFKAVAQSGCMVLEALSISHGKASAYLPVIDLLHGYFKITGADDRRTRREKITGRALELDRSLEDALPYLFRLLGAEGDDPITAIDDELKRRRTLDAIKRILLRESLKEPLFVIFEDLHWIDGETQALLNLLADSIATAKILLLVNYRPEYRHEWGSKTYYTQLRLDPLGKESAEQMLSTMLGDSPELAPLRRLIADRTEGNPFFMEETVQALFDDGALARNGTVKLTRALVQVKIPTTVQAILASRIDRLPGTEKDLLQTLAVLGRQFSLGLVKSVVSESEDQLNRMLSDLQLAEFIYEQPAASDVEYIFKHALTQEVAYNSVLLGRRRTLHERIGEAMEALFESSLADHYDELAYHYSCSTNRRKAVLYLQKAGRQAAQRSFDRLEDYLRELQIKEKNRGPEQ
jgi:class 3 adenylate cyclase